MASLTGTTQADPVECGQFAAVQHTATECHAVTLAWNHARDASLANVCMLHHLFCSNRQKLYINVCRTLVKGLWSAATESQASTPKVPFGVIKIAGDGRCGWRAILAAQNLEGFLAVPRPGMCASRLSKACLNSWCGSTIALFPVQEWRAISSKQSPERSRGSGIYGTVQASMILVPD